MLKNTKDSYGAIVKFFHWLISMMVFVLLISGIIQINISDKPTVFFLFTWHKTVGLIVLALMVGRIGWRFVNVTPALDHIPTWQRIASRLAHFAFYFLLIAMPLSGWIMSTASAHIPHLFGLYLFPMPGIPSSKPLAHTAETLHMIFAISIVTILSLHILAALRHHFMLKDNVLRRMLPNRHSFKKTRTSCG